MSLRTCLTIWLVTHTFANVIMLLVGARSNVLVLETQITCDHVQHTGCKSKCLSCGFNYGRRMCQHLINLIKRLESVETVCNMEVQNKGYRMTLLVTTVNILMPGVLT